jgi:hypothetical protein
MKFVERSVHGSKHVHLVVNCSMHSGIKPIAQCTLESSLIRLSGVLPC